MKGLSNWELVLFLLPQPTRESASLDLVLSLSMRAVIWCHSVLLTLSGWSLYQGKQLVQMCVPSLPRPVSRVCCQSPEPDRGSLVAQMGSDTVRSVSVFSLSPHLEALDSHSLSPGGTSPTFCYDIWGVPLALCSDTPTWVLGEHNSNPLVIVIKGFFFCIFP